MAALPLHRADPPADDPLPAALMPAPALPEALAGRTVKVPVSLLLDAARLLARELPRHRGNQVVIYTQDYGTGYRSAADMLRSLLATRGCPVMGGGPPGNDVDWTRALHQPDRRGVVVLAASPHELAPESPATRHATLVVELVPDPNDWPPQAWPESVDDAPGPLGRLAFWCRHPIVARRRAKILARIDAKVRALLA